MQGILNNSSIDRADFPDVEVLLATYNGGQYLSEFLQSLSAQQGVNVHLRVSDDGSNDDTFSILKLFQHRFQSFNLYIGPKIGPTENFLSLIQKSNLNIIALADQDDVWEPDHLLKAVERLRDCNERPTLSFSAVLEFGENKGLSGSWPKRFPSQNILSIISENLARGCTMVFNAKAREVIKRYHPKNAIMHDWWILLVVASVGKIIWTENPEINYRIHERNHVGGTPRLGIRISRFTKNIKYRNWSVLLQAEELFKAYGTSMEEDQRNNLSKFVKTMNTRSFVARWKLQFACRRFRTSIFDEIAIRLLLIAFKK
jgi:glycosyltransferase involved in cell wall biosynthesis